MPTTADYLNALIRDRNSYQQELNKLSGANVTNLTFTELNKALVTNIDNKKYGSLGNISFQYYQGNEDDLLTDLNRLSTYEFTKLNMLFSHCSSVNISLTNIMRTGKATNAANMFYYSDKAKTIDISNLNVCNVTNMSGMFAYCRNLVNIDISNLNVCNVTNMSNMFYYCRNLVNIDISNLNVCNVTSIFGMFAYCNNLSNNSLQNIIKCYLNLTNISSSYKNLSKSSYSSPFYYTNIVINSSTVGSDLLNKLTEAGWRY